MTELRKILDLLIAFALICFAASCDDGGGGGGGGGRSKYIYYVMKVLPDASYSVKYDRFVEIGKSTFQKKGVGLTSVLDNISFNTRSVNVDGAEVTIEIDVTNNGPDKMYRVWVVFKPIDATVSIDKTNTDGEIGGGVFYFLRNILPGETKTVTVVFNAPVASVFKSLLEVFSVDDRIVFQYYNDPIYRLWSVNMDGGDAFAMTGEDFPDYIFAPVYAPDGEYVAFAWDSPIKSDVGLVRTDGEGVWRLTCATSGYAAPLNFTYEGKNLYISYFDETLGTNDIYLLDVEQAKQGCLTEAEFIPITASPTLLLSETAALHSHDGSFMLYARSEDNYIEAPYEVGDPNDTCCPDWVFGSEGTYRGGNYYAVTTDPQTGLPNGPEFVFWTDLLGIGTPVLAPGSDGVLLKAGGCSKRKYVCWRKYYYTDTAVICDGRTYKYKVRAVDDVNGVTGALSNEISASCLLTSTGEVTIKYYDSADDPVSVSASAASKACTSLPKPGGLTFTAEANAIRLEWNNINVPADCTLSRYIVARDGTFLDDFPADTNYLCAWLPGCFARLTEGLYELHLPSDWSSMPLNYYDNPEAYTYYPGFDGSNPSWSMCTDRVIFTDGNNDVADCDPYNCDTDSRVLVDWTWLKVGARCTHPVGDW